jgi:hypothetical protein
MTTMVARLGTHRVHEVADGVLGEPLDVGVDGEANVLAVDGGLGELLGPRDDLAVARLLVDLLARGAGQLGTASSARRHRPRCRRR